MNQAPDRYDVDVWQPWSKDAEAPVLDAQEVPAQEVRIEEAPQLETATAVAEPAAPAKSATPAAPHFRSRTQLRRESDDLLLTGELSNLSVQGFCVTTHEPLKAGDRIFSTFRLDGQGSQLQVLAEVVWQRARNETTFVHGCRMVGVAEEDLQQIEAMLTQEPKPESRLQRLRGVWQDWRAARQQKTRRPRSAARTGRTKTRAAAATVRKPVAIGAAAALALVGLWSLTLAPSPEVSESTAPLVDLPKVAVADVPLLIDADIPEASVPESVPEPEIALAKVTTTHHGDLDVLESKEGLELLLRTSGPVERYSSFWLSAPRRYVIDVSGRKSAMQKKSYALDHDLVARLRIGEHSDKVRYVFDTGVAADVSATKTAAGLRIKMQRR